MEPVRIELLLVDKLSRNMDAGKQKVRELHAHVSSANKELERTNALSDKLGKTLGRLAGAFAIKELVADVTKVRGQFQQLEVAFTTMLQSSEKADALMQQLTRTAATTPFGLEDVAQGAKQLLAYGFEAEKVNETLVRLGDIAAGLSVPLNDLVYLYGTTMAQGRMYTQDLNQFTNRGIPMIAEIAKQFGVAESKVKELVEAGKVGFPEVQKVVESLTDEGGKFGGLMEEQSKTITGQISNIEDAISMMMNDIGRRSEGIINSTLSGVSYAVEHYEQLGRVLLGLTATYGSYRTAIMLVTAAKGWATAAEALHYNWLLLVEKAQKMLNATMLANPYVLVATLVAGVASSLVLFAKQSDTARESSQRLSDAFSKTEKEIVKEESEIDSLFDKLRKAKQGTQEYQEAKDAILSRYGGYLDGLGAEVKSLRDVEGAYRAVAQAAREAALARGKEMALKEVHDSYASTYSENAGKLRDALIKRVGEDAGKKMLGRLQSDLRKTGSVSSGVEKEIQDALRGSYDYGRSARWLQALRRNEQMRSEGERRADDLFQGARAPKTKTTSGASVRDKAAVKKERDDLQLQLDQLSSSAARGEAGKKLRDKLSALDKELEAYSATAAEKSAKREATAAKKAEAEARRAAAAAERRVQAQEKLGQELADLQRQNDAAEIDAMQEGLGKKLREIDNDYQARQNEIAKKESDWRHDNKKAGLDAGANGFTAEQAAELDKARELNEKLRQKAVADARKEELQAMRDYLKEYGSLEQQKLAITEEYAQKIAAAGDGWSRASIEAARDEQLAALDMAALRGEIDWETVFGDLGKQSASALRDLKQRLRAALDVKDISAENAQVLTEKIRDIEDAMTDRGDVLASLLPGLRERKRLAEQAAAAETLYQKALENESVATDKVLADKRGIQELLKGQDIRDAFGNKITVELEAISEENKDKLLSRLDKNSDLYKSLLTLFENLAVDTSKATQAHETSRQKGRASKALNDLVGGKSTLKQTLNDLFNFEGMGFTEVASLINTNAQSMSELVDSIGLGNTEFGEAVHGFAEGVGGFNGAIQSLASGDVFGAVGGVVEGFRGFGRMLGIGGGNAAEVAATISRLEERNALLQTAIEDLTEEMKSARGAAAIEISREAAEHQRETNANYLRIAKAQYDYHGAHSSFGHEWGGYNEEQIARLSRQIGRQWDGKFWSLSPEEMKKLRENVDMWEQILKTGKGGYGGRVAEKLNDYIDQAGKLAEITDALYENLTTTTKDNVFDDFLDSLYNLADGSEDVMDEIAENWQKMVNRMAVNNLVGAKFQKSLEDWYEDLAKLNEARTDGEITDEEYRKRLDALKAQYEGYVEGAKRDIETLREEGIIRRVDSESGVTQSGKSGAFTAMSQDQGTKLEGLFVSGQMHWASMDDKLTDVSAQIGVAGDTLKRIEEHTGNSASCLDEIKNDLKIIKRDGLKVK